MPAHVKKRETLQIDYLYHLAEAGNIPSILKHGLMSTKRLLDFVRVPEPKHTALLQNYRPDLVCLSKDVMIRDQRPMPPKALAPALEGGLKPSDWYALLNGFVFLWPDRGRMERQLRACRSRPQVLLTFDAMALLQSFDDECFVSAINTGNARRKPARRGCDTFVPFQTWLPEGFPTGQRTRFPAEFLFKCVIPTRAPYLLNVAKE